MHFENLWVVSAWLQGRAPIEFNLVAATLEAALIQTPAAFDRLECSGAVVESIKKSAPVLVMDN